MILEATQQLMKVKDCELCHYANERIKKLSSQNKDFYLAFRFDEAFSRYHFSVIERDQIPLNNVFNYSH